MKVMGRIIIYLMDYLVNGVNFRFSNGVTE